MKSLDESKALPILAGAGVLFGAWEVVPRVFGIDAAVLPRFSAVFSTILARHEVLFKHVSETAWEALVAFLLALALAVVLAIFVTEIRIARALFLYPILAFQNVPKAALAPLLVLWFAYGMAPKIAMGLFIAFFPIFEEFRTGLISDRTGLRRTYSVVNPGRWQLLWRIKIPEAIPYLFCGCRVGVTFAVVGAIVGELAQPSSGLGYLISQGREEFREELTFAAVLLVSLVGLVFYGILVLIEQTPFMRKYLHQTAIQAQIHGDAEA